MDKLEIEFEDKVNTGIPGLDELLEGGLIRAASSHRRLVRSPRHAGPAMPR